MPAIVSATLRRLAENRLVAEGFDEAQVRRLLDAEPGTPDDWTTFLLLSSRRQVADALADVPDIP